VGHAVRAMYLYSAATDVVAATRDASYWKAMDAVWQDVVRHKLYVTGGIGSFSLDEGFGGGVDPPQRQGGRVTCAPRRLVFWSHRMGLLTGEAQYFDVLERTLYNCALDGLGLSGDRFFYGNVLATSDAFAQYSPARSEWFSVACCPSNITRLVASIGGYLY